MLDKSTAFQTISLVLKRDILPNLSNEMAKEQTVAMISVLKNLDANTVQNEETFKQVNQLLYKEMDAIIQKIRKADNDHLLLTEVQEKLIILVEQEQSERLKWEEINELFCQLVQIVYQTSSLHSYIPYVRKIIRKQLDIELKSVF